MAETNTSRACRQYEASLEDYLQGVLEPAGASRLKAHLNLCRSCREALQAAEAGAQLLQGALEPAADPGPAFAGRVMQAIGAIETKRTEERTFWKPLETFAWRLAFSAALALALLLAYGLRARTTPLPGIPAASQVERQEIFLEPVEQPATGDEVLMAIAERPHGK